MQRSFVDLLQHTFIFLCLSLILSEEVSTFDDTLHQSLPFVQVEMQPFLQSFFPVSVGFLDCLFQPVYVYLVQLRTPYLQRAERFINGSPSPIEYIGCCGISHLAERRGFVTALSAVHCMVLNLAGSHRLLKLLV